MRMRNSIRSFNVSGPFEWQRIWRESNERGQGKSFITSPVEVTYEVIMMKFTIEQKSSLERSEAQNLAHM